MRTITAKEYRENHQGQEAYMEVFYGIVKVHAIDEHYVAHCREENGGYGRSFHLHANRPIIIEK